VDARRVPVRGWGAGLQLDTGNKTALLFRFDTSAVVGTSAHSPSPSKCSLSSPISSVVSRSAHASHVGDFARSRLGGHGPTGYQGPSLAAAAAGTAAATGWGAEAAAAEVKDTVWWRCVAARSGAAGDSGTPDIVRCCCCGCFACGLGGCRRAYTAFGSVNRSHARALARARARKAQPARHRRSAASRRPATNASSAECRPAALVAAARQVATAL